MVKLSALVDKLRHQEKVFLMFNFRLLFRTKSNMCPLFGFDGCPHYFHPEIYDPSFFWHEHAAFQSFGARAVDWQRR